MKKPIKAKKASSKKKKMKTTKKSPKDVLGCCTLTGSGPDEQYEGLTREQCRRLAISKGKNDRWVPGKCAEPD
jgi:hypothetical protein